jgi:hypothetical protein
MTAIWVEGLGRSFEQALDMLAAAVRDCPAELWETPMWPEPAPDAGQQFLGEDWQPITDPEKRAILAQRWVERRSTPWSVAWHALEGFDYDLNGEFGPWSPPPPFAGHPHWRDLANLPAAWPQSDVLSYIENCRTQVRNALDEMTDEKAARLLPQAHRYRGQPHAWLITDIMRHTTEHAAQIRQFITGAGTESPT